MLDELIEKHFTKLEEIKKLEESIKETKEIIKGTKKIISETDASLARLMRESNHESFLFQKDGKNLIVYSNGDDCVSFEEIPTLNDLKKELAVGRMLKGSKEIVEQGNINGLPIKKIRSPKQTNQYGWSKVALNSQIGTIRKIVDILEKR